MRFSELRLIKYGRFDDCVLTFPAGTPDLNLVFGDNEAGKSTTMSAISDLLFGFPHSTPYDFRFDKQLLRVGAVIDFEGGQLVCRRRKGNTATLLDDEERPLDEGLLGALLGGQNVDSFLRMFSLDHRRLRDGGQAILDARDDVGRAIFAAGAGLVGVSHLQTALEDEAKAIWTRRAGERAYHLALRSHDEAKARLRAALVKPAQWDELRKSLASHDAQLKELREMRAALDVDRQRVERSRRILAPAARRERILEALAELSDAPALPSDAAETVSAVETEFVETEADARLAAGQAKAERQALETIEVDPRLMTRARQIDALREEKGAVDASQRDLPKRRSELQIRSERLAALQAEVGWPAEAPEEARARLPSRVHVAGIRDLLEARSGVDASGDAARSELANRQRELEDLRGEAAALPAAIDLKALSAAIRFARSKGDLDVQSAAALSLAADRQTALQDALARLAPWTGSIEDLRRTAPPSDAEVSDYAARLAQARTDLADARRVLRDEAGRLRALELDRDQAVRDEHAVPPEAVAAARSERDGAWSKVRRHVLGETPLQATEPALDHFESAVQVADGLADQRFSLAEQSGRLVAIAEDIERAKLALQQGQETVEALDRDIAGLLESWAATAAGKLALDPAAAASWLQRRKEAMEAGAALRAARTAGAELERQGAEARAALLAALSHLDAAASEGEIPLGLLLERAEALEASAAASDQERSSLQAKIAITERAHVRSQAQVDEAARHLALWAAQWRPALEVAGLDAKAPLALARARLGLIEDIRGEVDEIIALRQRVEAIESDINGFEARLAELNVACGIEAGQRSLDDQVATLARAAADNAAAAERRENVLGALDLAQRSLDQAKDRRGAAQARLDPLFAIADVADLPALKTAIQRCRQREARRDDLEAIDQEMLTLGDGLSLEALLEEKAQTEPETLQSRSQSLQEQLSALSEEIERVGEERATCLTEFRRLDDGPDAAIAASDLAQARSEMEAQAEAYVRKRAEALLLHSAIERYRREKQAPLLQRASALFSTLTLGGYKSLTVDMDNGRPRLMGLTADGQGAVPVSVMSEGTVDQLFLALRLAAVEAAIDNGLRLPFLADDLFINYDDKRALAGFQVLAELAQKTQVLFFSHHDHLMGVAEFALGSTTLTSSRLA